MKLPYQCLSRLGQSSILCAAKGTSICTFNLETEPSLISSWTHPTTGKPENGSPQPPAHRGQNPPEQEGDQPPSKKRRLNSDENEDPGAEGNASKDDDSGAPGVTADGNTQKEKQDQKQKQKQKSNPRAQGLELPFVILLTATEDGSHVVAVTGTDKILWVFEHDGKGMLKELSQRVMPKRPSSIAVITGVANGHTILCADKFGDVYSLPLVPSAAPPEAASVPSTPIPTPSSASTPSASKPATTAANRFTVHSQRNLRALEDQQRILASRPREVAPKEGPAFEHELILGHVSMLTALVTATSPPPPSSSSGSSSRHYIITGDRDEHIRISRGIPQAHVIEGYCLGHTSFVNALCVPASRPRVLVSGGGDDELFLWDWQACQLLNKADLLGHVREVLPDVTKIAVSRLYSYDDDADQRCYIVALCELVPALFIYELLKDNTLKHAQTLTLPGTPLDASITSTITSSTSTSSSTEDKPRKLVVATDSRRDATSDSEGQEDRGEAQPSLLLFERDETGTWARRGAVEDAAAGGDLDISRDELDKILYPIGNLRKTEFEDDAEGEQSARGPARGSVAP
ncbi:tRNA (guanine-N(7)-)-methyltransferase non-catalytic subunit trm82 [Parahypoxylon ruwenzoriense]